MDEERLIDAAIGGDHQAFEALMKKYTPMVAGCLFGKAPPDFAPEDLVQEVFLKAYRRLGTLRRKDRLGPWLAAIARNTLRRVSYRNRLRRQNQVSITDAENSNSLDNVPDTLPGPSEQAERAELEKLLTDAIGRQRDRYRTVLYLRVFEGLTSREIATLLGLTESTARTRLQRGLEALRRDLRRRGIGAEPEGVDESGSEK